MAKSKVVKEVVKEEKKVEYPEMHLLDRKISQIEWETHVRFIPIFVKETGATYLKIEWGEKLDKSMFVSARKDGKGVVTMTSDKDFWYEGSNGGSFNTVKV